MTATPTLPPLPPPEIVELGGKKTAYYAATTKKLRDAAYQAGRDAGLEEAQSVINSDAYAITFQSMGQYRTHLRLTLDAIKSPAKESA